MLCERQFTLTFVTVHPWHFSPGLPCFQDKPISLSLRKFGPMVDDVGDMVTQPAFALLEKYICLLIQAMLPCSLKRAGRYIQSKVKISRGQI
jgi:hypothetical protein